MNKPLTTLTEPRASAPVFQELGTILSAEGAEMRVRTESGEFDAKRAVGCLVQPEPDDIVMLAVPPNGELFVVSILERPSGGPLRLTAEGDLKVQLPDGRFVVTAAKGVELVSGDGIGLAGRRLAVNANEADVFVEKLSFLGKLVHAQSTVVKLFADTVDSVYGRVAQTAKRSYRTISEMDVTRAKQIDYRAEELASIRAKTTVMAAEQLVKIDGKQIHLG